MNYWRLIRTLKLRKLWNIITVQLSWILSTLLSRPIVWGKPWFISIETASVCNLTCPQCPVGAGEIRRSNKLMSLEDYTGILGSINQTTSILSLYFQGEPLMSREFPEFVRRATQHGMFTQTSTNGQMLEEGICRELVEGGLGRIIVSLDGLNQESYGTYRKGGDISKVEAGIRTLSRVRRESGRRNPLIIIQFLVFRHNQDQVGEVKKIAGEWGADRVWIKSAQVEYPGTEDIWVPEGNPEAERYARYRKFPSGGWRLKGKLRNRCKRLWQSTVICSDSMVVPCCFDKRAEFPMGNSGETDIARIWKGKAYRDFRKRVLSEREQIGICKNCTEGISRIARVRQYI